MRLVFTQAAHSSASCLAFSSHAGNSHYHTEHWGRSLKIGRFMTQELYYLKKGNGESCGITGEILSHRLRGTGLRDRRKGKGSQKRITTRIKTSGNILTISILPSNNRQCGFPSFPFAITVVRWSEFSHFS